MKKNNLTNVKYQSTFLPLLSKAETDIKQLIIKSALFLKSKAFLRIGIKKVIEDVAEKLPKDLQDRQSYIEGLYHSSERMIKKYYNRMILIYLAVASILLRNKIVKKLPENQIELMKILEKNRKNIKNNQPDLVFIADKSEKFQIDMIFEQKGFPNVDNYVKKLKETIGDVARTEFAPAEEGKKKITVWQKAELDLRHEAQLNMVNNLVEKGVKYAWISSHPDCSKRCSRWQGKLVSLTQRAENPQKFVDGKKFNYNKKSFIVGKLDKHTVYSLPDIMDVEVEPYGYKNNIIGGFNCRHKLVPYTPNSVAPVEYDAEQIKKQREINAKLREYERKIRELKRLGIFYKTSNPKLSKMYVEQAKKLTKEYKEFAEKHGYAWLEYRLEV